MAAKRSVQAVISAALAGERMDSDATVWALASVSAGNLRDMVWTVQECADAMRVAYQTMLNFLREHEVKIIRFGNRAHVSKLAVFRAFNDALGGDDAIVAIFPQCATCRGAA